MARFEYVAVTAAVLIAAMCILTPVSQAFAGLMRAGGVNMAHSIARAGR